MQTNELVHQPGFADAGLSHDAHNLGLPIARAVECLAQLAQFALAADEAGQSSLRRRFQPRWCWPTADYLKDLDRGGKPLDRHRPERLDGHIAFRVLTVLAVVSTDPGLAICSTPAARFAVWPTTI